MVIHVRRWHLRHAITVVAALAAVTGFAAHQTGALRAQATPGLSQAGLDSVRVALASGDWNERHAALQELNTAYPAALPGAVVPSVISLLSREATARGEHDGDEEFGEYIVDLILTGVRTGDARVVPGILRLDGLGVSSGVASFVASQGRAAMPALDSLAATREDRASDVAEAYALMYARHGSRLTHADSAQVLRRLIQAASHASPAVRAQLAYVAGRGPIPELLPLVEELARSDPGQIEGVYAARRDAQGALPALRQASAALSSGELLNRLTLLTAAACDDAEGRVHGQCSALSAHLAGAILAVGAGRTQPAVEALEAYRRTVSRLEDDRLVPRLTAVTLDGSAAAVVARLAAR